MFDISFLRERKKILLGLAGIIVFLLALIGSRFFFEYLADKSENLENNDSLAQSVNDLIQPPVIENEDWPELKEKTYSPLTGLEIDDKTEVKPISVMIENHPASRPQMRGLNEAGIVIEALTEGGITRFLAIFDSSELKRVGPVRSARPYFVEWAEEVGGAFVHAGGSEAGLTELAESDLLDFDEDGEMVYRDFQFLAPHNLFVNLAEVRKTFSKNNSLESRFDFSGEIPERASRVKEFSLDFSLPSYFVEYIYNATDGKYDRLLGGAKHVTNGTTIRPTNIVIQFTEYFPVDDEGRLELETDGENTAWYFSEGKFWKGVWRKVEGQTQFFDNFGSPVSLNPGQTFVEILDASERISFNEESLPLE